MKDRLLLPVQPDKCGKSIKSSVNLSVVRNWRSHQLYYTVQLKIITILPA